jgi:uncharacterized protein YjaG (DUF416 family)
VAVCVKVLCEFKVVCAMSQISQSFVFYCNVLALLKPLLTVRTILFNLHQQIFTPVFSTASNEFYKYATTNASAGRLELALLL